MLSSFPMVFVNWRWNILFVEIRASVNRPICELKINLEYLAETYGADILSDGCVTAG